MGDGPERGVKMSSSTKYQILIRIAERPNNNSAFVFYKIKSNGTTSLFETEDSDELNNTVEELINSGVNIGGRVFEPRKEDLIIVSVHDWYADAVSDQMSNNLNIATEEDIDSTVDDIFDTILNSLNDSVDDG